VSSIVVIVLSAPDGGALTSATVTVISSESERTGLPLSVTVTTNR
jgi:hypothetical protein